MKLSWLLAYDLFSLWEKKREREKQNKEKDNTKKDICKIKDKDNIL